MAIRVQLPDGKIAEFPDGTDPGTIEGALSHYTVPPEQSAEQPSPNARLTNIARAPQAIADTIGGAISGLGANVYGAIHGYVTNPIARAIGLSDDTRTPTEIKAADQAYYTMQPSSPEGAKLQEVVGKPYALARQGVAGAGNLISPDVGAAAGDFLDVAPLAAGGLSRLGSAAGRGGASAAPGALQAVPEIGISKQLTQDTVRLAQKRNIKLSPQQAGLAEPGTTAGSLADPRLTNIKLSLENEKPVNAMLAEAAGLNPAKPVTPAAILKRKAQENQAYAAVAETGTVHVRQAFRDEVAAIVDRTGGKSFKNSGLNRAVAKLKSDTIADSKVWDAQDAVNQINGLRAKARANSAAVDSATKQALGKAQKQVAVAIENELARHAVQIGKPELATALKEARVKLAQLNLVGKAVKNQHPDASVVARYDAKNPGVLTGSLKDLAEIYKGAAQTMRPVNKLGSAGEFSLKDLLISRYGGLSGKAISLARPLIRGTLASDRYQKYQAKQALQPKAPRQPLGPTAAAALASYFAARGLDENGDPLSEAQ